MTKRKNRPTRASQSDGRRRPNRRSADRRREALRQDPQTPSPPRAPLPPAGERQPADEWEDPDELLDPSAVSEEAWDIFRADEDAEPELEPTDFWPESDDEENP